ncbi:hypothetical protein DFH07DRAFT_824057 [Mycena maculata]|uniref:Uncharacterized protein n=1 Tax=Mycena maculata TaxID=230809 RepID=A0AAD7J022_9AGAR|nr:hypothetical protein DFH07DRAFT_824057 [Mycena maculata]
MAAGNEITSTSHSISDDHDTLASVDSPPASPSDGTHTPTTIPMTEALWIANLKKLDKKIRKYNWKPAHPHSQKDAPRREEDAAKIVTLMRDLGATHPDPRVQVYWAERADAFAAAPEPDKKAVLRDVTSVILGLIAAPFAIAGALLLGLGKALRLTGTLMVESRG